MHALMINDEVHFDKNDFNYPLYLRKKTRLNLRGNLCTVGSSQPNRTIIYIKCVVWMILGAMPS